MEREMIKSFYYYFFKFGRADQPVPHEKGASQENEWIAVQKKRKGKEVKTNSVVAR